MSPPSDSSNPRIFVVIPAYNEGQVIGDVLDELARDLPRAEVVVIDDGSRDSTAAIARSRPIHVLEHIVNLGQGAALKTGIEYAVQRGADIIVTYDADGQMRPSDIPALIEPISAGKADIVLGTRFGGVPAEGITLIRRTILRAATWFTRASVGLPVTDAHNGFRALTRQTARSIQITQNRMAHASEILSEIARLELRWSEVPVAIRYTEHSKRKGQSSLGAFDILVDLFFRSRSS